MKTIAVLAIVATLGALLFTTYNTTSQNDLVYESFIAEYGRNYASQEEYNMRKGIFMSQLKKIEEHNAKGLSWTLGVNEFSDWTDEEYGKLLGLKGSRGMNSELPVFQAAPRNDPDHDVDWRDVHGYDNDVLNQGRCGSCWAFSATQAVEYAYFKRFEQIVRFSEQQMVDCDSFSHGCNGGLQENGYAHWMRNRPIFNQDYPYYARDMPCLEGQIKSNIPLLAIGWRVDVGDDLLYEALLEQPVSISIRAENDVFRGYKGGIIDGDDCGTLIDHAVTLVGYNVAQNYWIVKNSWGPNWGEQGYVRIARRGGMGICGINQQNSLASFDEKYY